MGPDLCGFKRMGGLKKPLKLCGFIAAAVLSQVFHFSISPEAAPHGPARHGGQEARKGKTLNGRSLLAAPPSFWCGLSLAGAETTSQQAGTGGLTSLSPTAVPALQHANVASAPGMLAWALQLPGQGSQSPWSRRAEWCCLSLHVILGFISRGEQPASTGELYNGWCPVCWQPVFGHLCVFREKLMTPATFQVGCD